MGERFPDCNNEVAFFLEPPALCLVAQMLDGEVAPGEIASCASYADFGKPCGRVGSPDCEVLPEKRQPKDIVIFDNGLGQCPTAPIGVRLE